MCKTIMNLLLASSIFVPHAFAASIHRRSCPSDFVDVVFNSGYNPNQFDTIGAAQHWITFGLDVPAGASANALSKHIPMMAFQSDVSEAVSLVNGLNPPHWLLTFNEPDYSYAGESPTMTPQQAASAIAPLLARPGNTTKFVAPVTADPGSDWLPQFYAACNCSSFFSAYNIHVYHPTVADAQAEITAFHQKFPDKHIWVTEIAPGGASPACSLSTGAVSSFMQQIYSWGAGTGWIDRIFWNSGNYGGDSNICNSGLLDANSNPAPILDTYKSLTC